MVTIATRHGSLEIRSIAHDDLAAVLKVYQQCEDFLALGPVPTASAAMVLKDVETSRREGGVFCGVYMADGQMIGIVDYIPSKVEGGIRTAHISLLMIAPPFREQAIGKAVVEAIENEITKDARVVAISSGVQVNNHRAARFWQRNGYRVVGGPEMMPDQTTVYHLRKQCHRWAENGQTASRTEG
jgi:ribosomal protein S18 acetylase RimI-like enzyme